MTLATLPTCVSAACKSPGCRGPQPQNPRSGETRRNGSDNSSLRELYAGGLPVAAYSGRILVVISNYRWLHCLILRLQQLALALAFNCCSALNLK